MCSFVIYKVNVVILLPSLGPAQPKPLLLSSLFPSPEWEARDTLIEWKSQIFLSEGYFDFWLYCKDL